LVNFKIQLFQLADTLGKLLSEIEFGLGDDIVIEYDLHIFGTIYCRLIFKRIRLLLAHHQLQSGLQHEPLCLAESEGREIYSEMYRGGGW
jgi:hypothetical protein